MPTVGFGILDEMIYHISHLDVKKPLHVELPFVFQRRPVLGRGPALRSWSWGWSRAKPTSRTLPLSCMLSSYRHPSRVDGFFFGTSTAHCLSTSWFWRWTCSVQHVGSGFFDCLFDCLFYIRLLLCVSALWNDIEKKTLQGGFISHTHSDHCHVCTFTCGHINSPKETRPLAISH